MGKEKGEEVDSAWEKKKGRGSIVLGKRKRGGGR